MANYNIKIVSNSYNAQLQDDFIGLMTEQAGGFILIPDIDTLPLGKIYVIKDVGNNASVNNIAIYTADKSLIDQQRFQIISSNGGKLTIISTGVAWSII